MFKEIKNKFSDIFYLSLILVLCFTISFIFGPYLPIPNIWIVAVGIGFVAAANIRTMRTLIMKFDKNADRIHANINRLRESHDELAVQRIHDRLDLQKQSTDKDINKRTIKMHTWMSNKNIQSLNDIETQLLLLKQDNSTIKMWHRFIISGGMAAYTAGSILQTINAAVTDEQREQHAFLQSLKNFPASIVVGAGYGIINFSHMRFIKCHAEKNYELSKWLKQLLSEELSEHQRKCHV